MLDYGWFYLKWEVGNNVFSYFHDKQHQLWVPYLKESSFEQLKEEGISLWERSVFAEVNDEWKVQEYLWLAYSYYFEKDWVPIYIFDNHNHAFAFWWREYFKWQLKKGIYLVHIDQHSDMNENKFRLESETWEDVVQFSNQCCNVWNFIIPGEECWLLDWVKQLRTEQWLLCYNKPHMDYILDIDLDFWDEKMWISDMNWTIKKVKNLIQSAKIITVATSPYFLNQDKALELINSIFS